MSYLKKISFWSTCGFALLVYANSASAISLKENSVLKGDKITLGDVFYDLPRDEDRVLGAAPNPGQKITLNARTLLRIALATDLPWRPSSNAEKITLKRDATHITQEQIENGLTEALYAQGVGGEFKLNIAEQYHSVALPSEYAPTFDIAKLKISTDQKKFDAILKFPSSENTIKTLEITGQIQPVIDVPVLRTNIQNGRVITADDIEISKIRDIDYTPDTIADAGALIGMTARRMIVAGRPIKSVDIEAQQLIERGSLIILSLEAGTLSLTTEAKALENGAKGDVIRVLNTASNQTIQAQVVSENLVRVMQN